MNEIHPAGLLDLAKRVIWFEPPEAALADPVRFLSYVMTYGTADDLAIALTFFGAEDFRDALEKAPPGIFDARSWAYWNLVVGRCPPPPMPRRSFGVRGTAAGDASGDEASDRGSFAPWLIER